ncbi:MAG: GTP-binding protein [Alphaproteobacteria bacterium]|nr:GTP-binding protein [Alphaproteobacteria bacterium]
MVAKKICIIGDFAVGKSSLVRRFVFDEFDTNYQATLGVNIYKYGTVIKDSGGQSIEMDQMLWDIEGKPEPDESYRTYLAGSAGALIVGDITREGAIDSLINHGRFYETCRPGRPIVFVLNKADLLDTNAQGPDSGSLVAAFGEPYLVTSAKTGSAVVKAFDQLARRIVTVGA